MPVTPPGCCAGYDSAPPHKKSPPKKRALFFAFNRPQPSAQFHLFAQVERQQDKGQQPDRRAGFADIPE